MADVLNRRLNDLAAADCLEDTRHLPGRCHELTGTRKGQVAMRLSGNTRLVFQPADDPIPTRDDGHAFATDKVPWPGETIRDLLEELDMTQSEFALRLGRTQKMVSQLLNGKAPITPETAVDLERVLRVPAGFWNNAERRYRDWLTRRMEEEGLAGSGEWVRSFPVREMAEYGWIPALPNTVDQARALLEYFGVASPASWEQYWTMLPRLAFRTSTAFQANQGALTAWLRQGEIQARALSLDNFDKGRFEDAIREARGLTTMKPKVAVCRLRRACANAGVAFVVVRELPGIACWGATRWLSPTKALIQLSLRYQSDDHLWFSFFHEAGHLLLHGKKDAFIECDGTGDDAEVEADRFAADILVPAPAYANFLNRMDFSEEGMLRFAEEISVAPGIIVGRLQHDGVLGWDMLNHLKRRVTWEQVEEVAA